MSRCARAATLLLATIAVCSLARRAAADHSCWPASVLAAGPWAGAPWARTAATQAHTIELGTADVDLTLLGAPRKDQLGNDIALGDTNGDARPDILAGAQWSSGSGRNIVGRSYVVYGRESWPAEIDMATGGADWEYFGAGREARFGSAVGIADWDGDGTRDLLVASLLADQLEQHNGGAVYLIRGGATGRGTVDFLYDSPDALIVGDARPTESDQLGTDLATGDLNADGQADIAVSAAFRHDETGAVFVWFGPLSPGTTLNLRTHPADLAIIGPGPNSWFGANIMIADATADGVDDLLVSSLGVSPNARDAIGYEPTDSGAVYVFAGRSGLEGVIDLTVASADATVVGKPGDKLGVAVAVGTCGCTGQPIMVADVTGDANPDLLLGAPMQNRLSGAVSVLAGPIVSGTYGLLDHPHLRLTPGSGGGRFGWSIATGELGDGGGTDTVIGAPWATVGGLLNVGLFLAVTGTLEIPGERVLSPDHVALAILGPGAGSGTGGATLLTGDTTGDGWTDLLIGLPDAKPSGRNSAGAIYVLHGPFLTPPPVTPTLAPTATHAATETVADPTVTREATPQPSQTIAATSTAVETGEGTPSEPTATGGTPEPTGGATAVSPSATARTWSGILLPVLLRRR